MNEPALRVLVAVRDSRVAHTIQNALQAEGLTVELSAEGAPIPSALGAARDAVVVEASDRPSKASSPSLPGSTTFVHDLRNRLAAIRNAVYLLKRKMPGEETKCREYAEIIEREIVAAESLLGKRDKDG